MRFLSNLKPYVIYSDKTLDVLSILMHIGGISLFPVVILREKYRDNKGAFWVKKGKEIINHESIHFQQAIELGVLPFYLIYFLEWLLKLPFYGSRAYENISFEREAYGNDENLEYLKNRIRYNWFELIIKNK